MSYSRVLTLEGETFGELIAPEDGTVSVKYQRSKDHKQEDVCDGCQTRRFVSLPFLGTDAAIVARPWNLRFLISAVPTI